MTARIGLIVPFDTSNDRELWRWCPPGTDLHITRSSLRQGRVGVDLAEATADLDDARHATRTLLAIQPDVVAFACTSGSFVSGLAGEAALRHTILDAGARAAITTSGALLDALALLGARRVALATPYPAALGERLVAFVEEAGYEAASLENLGLLDGADIQATSDDEIISLAERAVRPGADALFISCTGLGTMDLVTRAEAVLGLPVLTAIQVTMWAAFRTADGAAVPPGAHSQALFRTDTTRTPRSAAEVR